MKRYKSEDRIKEGSVAPRRGAWVETSVIEGLLMKWSGRTPQGCVG